MLPQTHSTQTPKPKPKPNMSSFDIEHDQYIETPWNIIDSYFRGQHLERFVRHQLESYNNFVGYQIIKTIEMFNPVHIASDQDYDPVSKKHALEIIITFSNLHIYRPQIDENNGAIKLMFPQEARLRNFTYASSTTIDLNIKYIVRNGPNLENMQTFHKTIPKVHIGKLPIMLKSNICVLNQYKHFENTQTGECKFDAGGYFIINGSEKTVLGQERAAENRVYCFNISKNDTKYTWKAEIKSVPDFKCISPKQINMLISSKNNGFGNAIYVELPSVKQPIHLFVVFRALGVISDKEICEKILLNIVDERNKAMLKALQASIIEANKYLTQEDCVKYITSFVMYTPLNMDKETGAKKKRDFTLEILNNALFPHCHNVEQKIYFLGYMANRLLMASFEIIKQDDRDSYLNKRVDLTGSLLNNLYRNYFNKLVKDMEKQVIREINNGSWKSSDDYENIINLTNIYKIIKSTTIENGIKRALSTGDFGLKHTNSNKVGVAQVLNRLNYVSSLSHARRISTPTEKSGKLIPPRKLHSTSWGFLCPAECFDPETPILMWDGTTKRAGDVVIGDSLVDDFGNETIVRTTCSGVKNMYDVIPEKGNFLQHRVTDNHILTLKIRGHKSIHSSNKMGRKYTYCVEYLNRELLKFQEKYFHTIEDAETFVNSFNDDDTLDVTIEKYLTLNKRTKKQLVLFKMLHTDESNFTLNEVGEGPYVGWQLHDKRGRFCLKDGLVVHNTPEGASVGVVKNLAYMSHITIYSNSIPLYEYVLPNIIKIDDPTLTPELMYGKVKVFINGAWVGVTDEPEELYAMLKDKKHKGIINVYTSIVFDYKMCEIRVCNDGGRLTRPLLRVKDNNILITNEMIRKLNASELVWDNLLTSSKIDDAVLEYIDPEEQSWSLIANKPKDILQRSTYTHCEIHPSTIFGVLASCIPFPEHNQSPRNTYQCLDINETVLLTNGRKIPIKDIQIGDKVVCFNPTTMETEYTTVVNQYVRETDKKIYKIKTLTDREIIATDDHKFMTTEGWKEVKDFVENDTYIGIMPNPCHIDDGVCDDDSLILNEDMFREKMTEYGLSMSYINKQIVFLTEAQLLPLYTNNYVVPILARIFGFLLADGSINIYERNTKFTACSFDFGTECDIKTFENDVYQCGFNKCKYSYGSRTLHNTVHSTYSVTHNGPLPSLLIALGVTFGKKTETYRKPIPEWIMSGSLIVKREFIAGFQGGDGCKIRWNKMFKRGYNFVCGETSQQINPTYKPSLEHFMRQCTIILADLGIDTSMNTSSVSDNRLKVSYKIIDKHINLINYIERIGYRYSNTKYTNSFIITEYLKYKNICYVNHKIFIENIRREIDDGKTNTSIANTFNISVSNVSDIRRSYLDGRKISMCNLKSNTIEKWVADIKIINNMVFMPVVSIEEVENRLISDITVASENHSFIAGNNFLSSNCAQGKQAMGVYVTNYENRMDKTAYVLNYPMRPLVDTRIMNMIQLNKIPSGTQVIVAIMTHTGYNQEDSLLINKGSIDRGMALVTVYHTEKDEDKQKINGDEEIRCRPDATKTKGMKMGNYSKVNSRGVIPENVLVENRDIIISKVTPIKENRNDHTKIIKFEDQSKMYKTVEETYIDRNFIDRNGDGYNFAKVRIRAVRKPVIGDKFSSRHGQKGTVGNIIPECDMPFTSAGLKPDIIINPHAIPSRMTIGQLKETVLGKVLIELGLFGDGTAFSEFDVKDICNELIRLGYEAHGNELLYNGLTGEQHECSVFVGPVFYQRLKHMVNDKAHSRSIGPMVNLTRQPAEGRSRDGGLRFGEMERDCFGPETIIALSNGLGIKIKDTEDCDHEVLGWDESCQQMVPSKQIGHLYKGERECVQITYQDGRTNICTPEHPILTADNQWIKAKDLVVGTQRVKASVTCPLANIKEEIAECNGWSLRVGDLTFTTDTKENYAKTLIFAKLLGYIITDGTIKQQKKCNGYCIQVFLGHMIDVNSVMKDLRQLCDTKQVNFKSKNLYYVHIPAKLANQIVTLEGILIGKRVNQPATLPAFIMDPSCPTPIIREFLGGLFGGDGHTCVLGMHRGKRDILSSVSFSQTKHGKYIDSLHQMMVDIKTLFARFDIHNITIQNSKETTSSKKKTTSIQEDKSYQSTLHLNIDELVPFAEKIGFRYCCHKSQRLEAGVSYKRLRNEVTRQHNWIVNRVDELTRFSEIKAELPSKIVPTKSAIKKAVAELREKEAIVHEYAIPTTHDITDHLIKGTVFGSFRSNKKGFPTAEEYLAEVGALDWFITDNIVIDADKMAGSIDDEIEDEAETETEDPSKYGVNRVCNGLPTMDLKVIDIRPAGMHKVYDIEVEHTHSFLANGIVAHNCMVSHGASRFTRGRLYDASDKYSVHVCKKCGLIASYNEKMHIHHCRVCDNRADFAYVEIPYACKLLFQELNTMNIAPRLITEN